MRNGSGLVQFYRSGHKITEMECLDALVQRSTTSIPTHATTYGRCSTCRSLATALPDSSRVLPCCQLPTASESAWQQQHTAQSPSKAQNWLWLSDPPWSKSSGTLPQWTDLRHHPEPFETPTGKTSRCWPYMLTWVHPIQTQHPTTIESWQR